MEDARLRDYVEDLLKNIRTQVLMRVIKPYTRVGILFIAGELKIPEKDVEARLVSPSTTARIRAPWIDQLNKMLAIQRDLDQPRPRTCTRGSRIGRAPSRRSSARSSAKYDGRVRD